MLNYRYHNYYEWHMSKFVFQDFHADVEKRKKEIRAEREQAAIEEKSVT